MNTGMVNQLMAMVPGFRGTFPCDLLPETEPNMSFIANTETSVESGEHWVAVYITDKTFYFFDSFGRSIQQFSNPFKKYMNNASRDFHVVTSSKNLQHIFSDVCGLWCIYYLWCKFSSYKFMFRHFTNDQKVNDEKLQNAMDFINRILPEFLATEFKFDIEQFKRIVKIQKQLQIKRLRDNI